ncbi:MAG: DUF853 family protein [Planctomycetota bacterium]|nr:MAG: DUF853 family protein [Planctomycetota bacterium]
MQSLQLSPSLSLPADAVTQTFAILAVRGAGKSNAAAAMAEGMYDAGLPFVVVDPVGAWWGLRSSADGKGAGLPVPVFGGRHGDVPLERTAGQLIGDLVVDRNLSCVLDVSDFSEGDKTRFLIDFAERLYRRNESPRHLFLEEADDYAPQRPFREQARLLRAWENVVRRGRARGLGITMITQRSAALNKNVLTQIETLFVLRTTSPQDRKAIEGWVEYHGQGRELLASLPELETGEAWIWSPHWLRVLKRIRIRRRRTFDSGATPKDARARPPATMADVDLERIRVDMAATIERAKAEDPRELRKQIEDLKRQLAQAKAVPTVTLERVEVPVLEPRVAETLASLVRQSAGDLESLVQQARTALCDLDQRVTALAGTQRVRRGPDAPVAPASPAFAGARPAAAVRPSAPTSLPRAVAEILNALAGAGRPLSKLELGILTGYRHGTGGFGNALSEARTRGFLHGGGSGIAITEAGRAALQWDGSVRPPDVLVDLWCQRLTGRAKDMLRALVASPGGLTREELGRKVDMEPAGGGFGNYLSELRTSGLLLSEGGRLKPHPLLLEEGRP